MNCQEFWNTMPELARKPDQLAHLRDCPACARGWEQQCALTAGLRAVAAESSHVQAPPRVEARLAAAFREHSGARPVPLGRSRQPRMWIPVATWFAAAAALVLVALLLLNNRQPQPIRRNLEPGFESAMVLEAPVELEFGDDSPDNNEDFIPLPNAQRIAPDEDVNVVRVELQRSAMISLGYDVSADRASEPVEAEVVLGADGHARAVRFLD
jgi:hypothetical protein